MWWNLVWWESPMSLARVGDWTQNLLGALLQTLSRWRQCFGSPVKCLWSYKLFDYFKNEWESNNNIYIPTSFLNSGPLLQFESQLPPSFLSYALLKVLMIIKYPRHPARCKSRPTEQAVIIQCKPQTQLSGYNQYNELIKSMRFS